MFSQTLSHLQSSQEVKLYLKLFLRGVAIVFRTRDLMTKDPQIFLKHILDSIEWIEKDIKGLTRVKFLKNVPIQDAVIRRVEIIGEAVRNIPANFRNKYPKTPWKNISGMRDKLIHQYFGVELDLVWEVAKKDIPVLKREVKKMLKTR